MRIKQLYLSAVAALAGPAVHYRALAALRVYLAFHVIKRLVLSWPYLHLLYGPESFAEWTPRLFRALSAAEFKQWYLLISGGLLAAALLMLFGIGRRYTVALVWVGVEVLQRLDGFILNGGDNLIKFILLYLVFCDSFRYLSIKRSDSNATAATRWWWLDNAMTNLGAYFMLIHLCVVYIVSGIHKAHADVWFNGTAVHYTLLIERFKGTAFNDVIANNTPLVVFGTYFTLFWELTFPLFIWQKWLRYFAIAGGVAMHLGIYVFMMIHDFEILFLALYVLAFKDEEWKAALDFVRRRFRSATPLDANSPSTHPA